MKTFSVLGALVMAFVLLICVPASGIKLKNPFEDMGLPDPILDQLGSLMYATKLKTCTLCERSEDLKRINAVWDKLLKGAQKTAVYKEAKVKKWDWQLAVVEAPSVQDAEALPGGKVIVYTGAIGLAGKSSAQAAFILAHEMAHALGRHAKSRIDKHTQTAILAAVTGGSLNAAKLDPEVTLASMAAMGVAYEGAAAAPFAKKLETEADLNAAILMARAGYDPRAAIVFLEKLGENGSGAKQSFLTDHPPVDKRIADLQKQMPTAMKLYEKYKG